jgi:type II secretory pathway component PulJ
MNTRTMLPRKSTVSGRSARSSERGMSLVEALVAIFIFSIAFITALMLYQTANRTYLRTDASAVQQQNVRFALDRMSETLRDAGAGHNMIGSSKLADEQIEGAWESAVFVRGDFDNLREDNRDSATFPIITTGNDEIVGYVLRKADNSLNTIPLTIIADLTPTVRDAIYTSQNSIANEETRTVMVAASKISEQDDPPYRLERVTFAEDTGLPKYEVVADNIFRLSFRYMEDNVTLQPVDFDTAVGGANNERDERAKIRRIEINLTGMTDRPDLGYKDETVYDPAVPEFTRAHRKFSVTQNIYAPNLGIIGSAHNSTLPLDLPTPTYITACAGHCRTYLISWPPSSNAAVTMYRLEITAPADGTLGIDGYFANEDVIGTSYEFREPDDDIVKNADRTFTFRVAPMAGPIVGAFTTAVARDSLNGVNSVPSDVTTVTAAQAATGINALRVNWDPVTTNTGVVTEASCISAGTVSGTSAPSSPWNGKAVDLGPARVYRTRFTGTNTGADVGLSDDITDLEIGELINQSSEGGFVDKTAAPCSSYFYRVKACDLCDVRSPNLSEPMAEPASFSLDAGVVPAQPEKPTPVGDVSFAAGLWSVKLHWSPVTRTNGDDQAAVSHYVVQRYRRLGNSGNWNLEPAETQHIYDGTESETDTAPGNSGGQSASYRYTVKAVYDCSVARESAESEPYEIGCVANSNTMDFSSPPAGDVVTRPGETAVNIVMATTGTGWTSATLNITDEDGNTVYGPVPGTIGTNSISFPTWNVSDDQTLPNGNYTLSVTAMVGECAIPTPETRTIELDSVACGQRIVGPFTWNATSGGNAWETLTFRVENTCPFAVTFNAMQASWTGVIATNTVNRLQVGGTTHYSNSAGAGLGVSFPLSPAIVLPTAAANGTASQTTMSLRMSNNFSQNGNGPNQGGVVGKFSSIFINVTSPESSTEQLIDDAPIP